MAYSNEVRQQAGVEPKALLPEPGGVRVCEERQPGLLLNLH